MKEPENNLKQETVIVSGQDFSESSQNDVEAEFSQQAALVLHNSIKISTPLEGVLEPFSSTVIALDFNPLEVGAGRAQLKVEFLDNEHAPIILQVTAECTDLPVTLQNTVANFLTCQYDRVYTESLVVCNNHNNSAVKVQFELPPKCQQYFSFAPKNAFLPAKVIDPN